MVIPKDLPPAKSIGDIAAEWEELNKELLGMGIEGRANKEKFLNFKIKLARIVGDIDNALKHLPNPDQDKLLELKGLILGEWKRITGYDIRQSELTKLAAA